MLPPEQPIHGSARHPAAAYREYLPDEAISVVAAKISRELRILARTDETAERHFPLQSFLEARIGLNLRRKIDTV
jgi:hypothetical protein